MRYVMMLSLCLAACGGSSDEAAQGGDGTSSGSGAEAPSEGRAAAPAGQPSSDPRVLLEVGALAPAFRAPDQTGATRTLAEHRGRVVVLYFYPRDATPGCTIEACAFRDTWSEYTRRGVALLGVSVDDVESHREFAEEHELPFPLLSDTDLRITDAYGARDQVGEVIYSRRVTFVIDAEGVIRHVFANVDPGVHAREVLAALDAL
ncbi:MAG: peroxiredoxin [Sandaracinaceae bacterium]|nr:peroxiredoxin [Sandaracinaceae bacterium]